MITEEQILAELKHIIDPDFQRDIVSLGFIKELQVEGGKISFQIELTTPACPLTDQFKAQAEARVGSIPGVEEVEVIMTARKRPMRNLQEGSGLKGVKQIIAVSSCKGGVGKSTVAAMLARSLADRGSHVGLLDADIYGPSVPSLFNLHNVELYSNEAQQILPLEQNGLRLMSFGFVMGEGPVVLRGPLVSQYMQQLLHNVAWGELDYLILDLPPGTGDIQLTISQSVPLDAAVVVTTPHQLAQVDVQKGIMMFDKVSVPILGVIENMAYFICDGCDKKHYPFGSKGGQELESRFGVEVLAELPISGQLSGGLVQLVNAEAARETTDAVVRAIGRQTLEKPSRPSITFDAHRITLSWPDEADAVSVPNKTLRAACGCALCIDELTQKPLLDPATIPETIQAEQVQLVGNYAVAVDWSDGHNTGYFSFRTIRELAEAAD